MVKKATSMHGHYMWVIAAFVGRGFIFSFHIRIFNLEIT